jgi:hypothetical protein
MVPHCDCYVLRKAAMRQVGPSPRGRYRSLPHDQSQAFGSLAQGDALAAVGSPTQRADEHHGIVMDWGPQRFGEKLLEKPV